MPFFHRFDFSHFRHWKHQIHEQDKCTPAALHSTPCFPWLDAGGCRSVRSGSEPAQLLWPGEDGLHDGVCGGDGCWSHVWHFLLSQVTCPPELSAHCLLLNCNCVQITSRLCFRLKRIGMRGRELMGGVGKTMMQSGGTFGTFMAIGMGIRCWGRTTCTVMGLF